MRGSADAKLAPYESGCSLPAGVSVDARRVGVSALSGTWKVSFRRWDTQRRSELRSWTNVSGRSLLRTAVYEHTARVGSPGQWFGLRRGRRRTRTPAQRNACSTRKSGAKPRKSKSTDTAGSVWHPPYELTFRNHEGGRESDPHRCRQHRDQRDGGSIAPDYNSHLRYTERFTPQT